MIVLEKHLKARHIRFLRLISREGTICVGLAIGEDLARWGYVERTRNDRYAITEKGRSAVENQRVSALRVRSRPASSRDAECIPKPD